MKNIKFSEIQIMKILSEQNHGKTVNEICRENRISEPTFYSLTSNLKKYLTIFFKIVSLWLLL